MITIERISRWLDRRSDASFMLVHRDTFSNDYWASYADSEDDLRNQLEEARKDDMHSVKEVYSYDEDLEEQLNSKRTWRVS